MPSTLSDKRTILIAIGMIITAILAISLGILGGPESMIIWLMSDTACTLLLIGLKGDDD